jgi:hypothetical protein
MSSTIDKYRPECLFCGRPVKQPVETRTDFGQVLAGRCDCGAVYVCDPTGHNVGEAFSDGLALAKGDWNVGDMAGDEYDYEEMDYDLKLHCRLYGKGMSFSSGKLLFLRMSGPAEPIPSPAAAKVPEAILADPAFMKLKLKDQVRFLLEQGFYEALGTLAAKDKNVLKWLISFSYDKEDAAAWRAIEGMGYAARALRAARLDVIRETTRRLIWSMTDESGGIGWSSPEHLGEIVRSDPDEFQDIIPIIWSFREEDTLRSGVVWAMGRIAAIRPEKIVFILNDIEEVITDPSPTVRGFLAILLKALAPVAMTAHLLARLNTDTGRLKIYENGVLHDRSVADLAA